MDRLKPTCQANTTYLERKKQNPQLPTPEPRGSYAASKKCGCRYCSLACEVGSDVVRNRSTNQDAVAQNSSLVYFEGDENVKEDIVGIKFRGSGMVFTKGVASTEVFVVDRADDPILPLSSSIPGYTGSDKSFDSLVGWFKTCVTEHRSLCRSIMMPDGKAPELPDRLIDVGTPNAQIVKLVETAGQRGHYACLSHSWGSQSPLRTTLLPDTVAEFKEEIQWNKLPKTFQDAVVLCRKFGFQYLWIDSLCIIQDSTEDWRIQSASMARIYRNAVITIAGSASSNPHQGLFRKAAEEHMDICLRPGAASKIQRREPLLHDAHRMPLMKRGWVFQERLLSSRYLHFGDNELIWECMEHLTCECGSLSIQDLSRHKWLEPKNRLHPDSLQHLIRLPNRLTTAWRAAVVDYSRMSLSYTEDILPAISGIAKSVLEATDWEYVAGLWKETLVTDLAWRTESPESAQRCEPWRAPTFSWASVTQGEGDSQSYISYAFMDRLSKGLDDADQTARTDIHATVVETRCESVGEDTTGQLKSAHIVLRGTLIKANLRCRPGFSFWKWCIAPFGKEPLSNFLYPDVNFDRQEPKIQDKDEVYCLKLIGMTQTVNDRSGEYLLYLVLRLVRDSGSSGQDADDARKFERIGLLEDAGGTEQIRLEDGSNVSSIERDALVRVE